MRFLLYVLLIFSVVSCCLNAIILNLIFGVCCTFLVLLTLLTILSHDPFFHVKIIDLCTKKMSSVKKHKIVFHLTSILLFLHIVFTTISFTLASIIFKGKNQFQYFIVHVLLKLKISDRQMNNLEERQVEIDLKMSTVFIPFFLQLIATFIDGYATYFAWQVWKQES